MSNTNSLGPNKPEEYDKDDDIPFTPEGNSPLISGYVEKVFGTSGRFKGMHCVRKTVMQEDSSNRSSVKRLLMREVRALHNARHTHVVRLVHTYFDNRSNQIRFCIVMDRAETNLSTYLDLGAAAANLPRLNWFGCMLVALQHIHSLGIRHRDIKPSNILVKKNQVLLADFGISQMGLGKTMPTTNLGRNAARPRDYCAPEVEEGRSRGRSADIFSLGAVFLEMCTAHSGKKDLQALANVLQTKEHSSYAQNINLMHKWINRIELTLEFGKWQGEILHLCKQMLHPDRDQRPSAANLQLSDQLLRCTCTHDVPITLDSKLLEACKYGSADLVLQLLLEDADPRLMGAIHLAAERGSKDIVRMFLERGADVDSLNQVDQTPLHCASRSGSEDVVKLLLNNHSSVNARDENKQTPLHGAAAHGYEAIVRMLLQAGANTELKGSNYKRPYALAKGRGHTKVLELLDGWMKGQQRKQFK